MSRKPPQMAPLGELAQRDLRRAFRAGDLRTIASEMQLGPATVAYLALGRRARARSRERAMAWLREQSGRAAA